jgi:hypothetical protein
MSSAKTIFYIITCWNIVCWHRFSSDILGMINAEQGDGGDPTALGITSSSLLLSRPVELLWSCLGYRGNRKENSGVLLHDLGLPFLHLKPEQPE